MLLHQYSIAVWGICAHLTFRLRCSEVHWFSLQEVKLKLSLRGYKNIENDSHAVTSGSEQISTIIEEVTETAPAPTHMGFSFRFIIRQQVIKFQLHFLMSLTTSIPSICLRNPLITS